MALIQSIEGLNKTKGLTFPQAEGNSSYLNAEPELRSFSSFRLKQKHWLVWGIEPTNFQTGTYTINSPCSQTFRLLLQHIYLHTHTQTHTHTVGSFSLENPNTTPHFCISIHPSVMDDDQLGLLSDQLGLFPSFSYCE